MLKIFIFLLVIFNNAFCFTDGARRPFKDRAIAKDFFDEYPQIDYSKIDKRHKEVKENFRKCIVDTEGDFGKFKKCFNKDNSMDISSVEEISRFISRERYHELSFFTTEIKIKKENDFFELGKDVLTFNDLCTKESYKECMGESNFDKLDKKALITYIYALFYEAFFEIESVNSKKCYLSSPAFKNFKKSINRIKGIRFNCLNSLASYSITLDREKKYSDLYIGVSVDENAYLREETEYQNLYETINSYCFVISNLTGDKTCVKNLKEIFNNGFVPVDNS